MVLRQTRTILPLPLPGIPGIQMLDPPCLARLSPCSEALPAVHQGTGQQDMAFTCHAQLALLMGNCCTPGLQRRCG